MPPIFKNHPFILLFVALTISCSPSQKNTDDTTLPENTALMNVTGPDFNMTDSLIYYKANPFTGRGLEFHETWGTIFEGNYLDGKKDGQWISYSNGTVIHIITYKSGLESGLWQVNFSNGKPMVKGEFLNGLETGRWELYYENGQLTSYSTFKEGKRVGIREEFNRDGSPWFKKYYEDGVEVSCEGDCNLEEKEWRGRVDIP